MELVHEENMRERVQAAGSRYLVQVMLESMIVVTDVQLMCTVHACARQIQMASDETHFRTTESSSSSGAAFITSDS